MIERANAFLQRYALLLLLVFLVFVFFDLFYVSPIGREIAAKRSLVQVADERLEGLTKELARLKGIERESESGLAQLLAATRQVGPATREIAFLHGLAEALDARALASGPVVIKRSADPALRVRLLTAEFDWEGTDTAAAELLADLAALPDFVTVDAFSIQRGKDGRFDGAMTVTLRSREVR